MNQLKSYCIISRKRLKLSDAGSIADGVDLWSIILAEDQPEPDVSKRTMHLSSDPSFFGFHLGHRAILVRFDPDFGVQATGSAQASCVRLLLRS